MTKFLTPEEVIAINLYVIEGFSPGELSGVKAPDLLDSAVNRPKHSAFGDAAYQTIIEQAAALFESLAQNHAFHNADKRTAFLSLLQFLGYNGYAFVMDLKQAEDIVVDVVIRLNRLLALSSRIATGSSNRPGALKRRLVLRVGLLSLCSLKQNTYQLSTPWNDMIEYFAILRTLPS